MNLKANLSTLSPEQREAFAKINALLGLGPDECTYRIQEGAQPQKLILSSEPEHSNVPPYFVPIGSIAELRKVAGYEDIHPKTGYREADEIHYPESLSESHKALLDSQPNGMKPIVSPELKRMIEKAAIAFVMLDPERVREYEPLINAVMFPGKVAAFVAEDLEVQTGQTVELTGNSGTVFNYGTVTVHPGGSIIVAVDCTFNCQIFTQL